MSSRALRFFLVCDEVEKPISDQAKNAESHGKRHGNCQPITGKGSCPL